ncbi:N-carbamoyl-L-amino acid hydrolase [Usitatibacter rugosus]|uniref:N-carbamoyl-L-amino acid hydrolase n=1 Tax=Usitatibacter rugosus TaxID=2732067 RepID=A0A6M4GSP5_9PROT|nr:allantoate amidohydrolase [Usitatibacter rugosus]QJR09858.1 N-carbamoyl-L-amino acid hydrolase [Usitatibacter rugosus]
MDVLHLAASLARHSDSADHYTRLYLTSAHRAAAKELQSWMVESGLRVRVDSVGNVIGRYDGATRDAKTLLLGSHFDSVRNGGKYDGVLGILVPMACVAELHRRGERLPCAIEVAAFADEEGARFATGFLSSRAMIGDFDRTWLDRRDADGVSMREAMRDAELDPEAAGSDPLNRKALAGYLELHIEQGPVLLDAGLALGVVTTISGGNRHSVVVIGEAGHAGTVPMQRRHDALTAASEMVLAIERRCGVTVEGSRLVGTVGILKVVDGSSNVIPGRIEFSLDIRAGDDATRIAAEDDIFAELEAIAKRRGVRVEMKRHSESTVIRCADRMQDLVAASIAAVGLEPLRLPSGAGHDAMMFARICDVGMMFVRCGAGGVSHNPAETVTAEDVDLARRAVLEFMRRFGTVVPA